MIDWLPEELPPSFPSTKHAQEEPNGLLAAGGLLTPKWLVESYSQGIFPWFDDESPILWWSPAPRMILKPGDFRINRSLRKLIKRTPYKVSCNLAFSEVIYQCAQPREDDAGTWITEEMLQAYIQLNDNKISHSVECWDDEGVLVGGLYGVLIGKAFFGESMFSRSSNASKIAFALFAQYLIEQGIEVIDCQMHSDHMEKFGAGEVGRKEFECLLLQACDSQTAIKLPAMLSE